MNALFIHDNIFLEVDRMFYSEIGFSALVWKRYLAHFNHLTVIGRGKKISESKEWFSLSSMENVNFDLFYEIKGGCDYYKYKKKIKKKLLFHINQADVVIIRLPSTIGYFAADVCRKYKKPYVTEVVGCAYDSSRNYGLYLLRIMAPYVYNQMRKSVKNSMAAIYATTDFLQKRYPSYGIQGYASNVQLMPVSDDVLKKHQERLSDNKDFFKIGMIANLAVKYKGHDIALKALKQSSKNGLKFKFYMVGGGDDSYVKNLIRKYNLQENVIIIGSLKDGEAVLQFLDELDLYIHTSRQEGLSRAIIEAMSRGCPVLASSIAGTPELLGIDYMHCPGDSKTLSKQINKVLNDKRELLKMSEVNFFQSKKYLIPVLKERRDIFFSTVKQTIT